jgi:hypothetical protein
MALAGPLASSFCNACAAQLVLRPGGGGRNTSVLTGTLLQDKNKIFLGKSSSAIPQLTNKNKRCGMLRLSR